MKAILAAILGVLLCVEATSAWAVYCGNRLVSLMSGQETQTSVWSKCGEPDTMSQYVQYRPLREMNAFGCTHITGYVPVVTEVWVYNFGPRRFMQQLSFEDGSLNAITSLGYGY